MSQSNTYFGAHVSASGGIEKAVDRAVEIGANCLQLFSGSPRVWKRNDLSSFNVEKFRSKIEENNFGPIITHSLYLVNLASDKPELLEKTRKALRYDLEFDAHIGGSGIVVHLGSHTGRGWEAVRDQVAEEISNLLTDTPEESTFLIENSAGQNGKLCSDFEHIRWLLDQVSSKRLGWCFDTCHAHAAGYGLGEKRPEVPDSTKPENNRSETAVQAISRLGLWEPLACVHVNDSRDGFATGKDRHENLGRGEIPQKDLKWFLNQKQVSELPLILEVPGMDGNGPDKENLDILKKLCN